MIHGRNLLDVLTSTSQEFITKASKPKIFRHQVFAGDVTSAT